MNLNQVHLIGRVTKDPELKSLQSGTQVVNFGLATNNTYKDKDGKKVEQTDFHNITAFGKLAETLAQYVIKGQELYIGGRIRYETWDKEGGGKGYKTNIIADRFQFGQKPKGAEGQAPAANVDSMPE